MTLKETNDGNRLIAQWMDYEYIPFNNPTRLKPGWWKKNMNEQQRFVGYASPPKAFGLYLARSVKDLKYHNDWNWLMSAVEKIIFEQYASLVINGAQLTLSKESKDPFLKHLRVQKQFNGALNCKPVELVWQLVTEYVKNQTDESV